MMIATGRAKRSLTRIVNWLAQLVAELLQKCSRTLLLPLTEASSQFLVSVANPKTLNLFYPMVSRVSLAPWLAIARP
jgi:hypothetical protein